MRNWGQRIVEAINKMPRGERALLVFVAVMALILIAFAVTDVH